jgi:acylphosphatase
MNQAESSRRSVRLRLTGRVQGVGFRDFVQREAAARELDGWVRNRRDGSVEAVIVGAGDAVDALIAACRDGPAAAVVAEVEVSDYSGTFLTGFMVLPTQ